MEAVDAFLEQMPTTSRSEEWPSAVYQLTKPSVHVRMVAHGTVELTGTVKYRRSLARLSTPTVASSAMPTRVPLRHYSRA